MWKQNVAAFCSKVGKSEFTHSSFSKIRLLETFLLSLDGMLVYPWGTPASSSLHILVEKELIRKQTALLLLGGRDPDIVITCLL